MPAEPQKPSLYERLGGIYSISCVVDDLIDRVMTDARLNANPAVNEAHHKVPPPGFKYLVTEMVGWASGGPQVYTGRPMRESHEHLKITPKEWEAFMDDLQQSLDRFNVPSAEQTELKAIVQSTYGDIVIGKDEAPETASAPLNRALGRPSRFGIGSVLTHTSNVRELYVNCYQLI